MTQQDFEQYKIFTEKLRIEQDKSKVLIDIKNMFEYKPAIEAVPAIRNIGISRILHCLNTVDKTQMDLACDVLQLCFQKFQTGEIVQTYTSNIMYLLRHEQDCVRKLAIDEVCKTVIANPKALQIPKYIDVFVAVAQMVIDRDVGIANKAVLITSNLPDEAYTKVLEEMQIALDGNSSSKCNAYEVVVNISSKSLELLQLCVQQGYLDFMIKELQADDILYQLNILELLSQLAIKPHGINYLVKQGCLERISQLVQDLPNNPFGSLLIPGYMKFFGSIAHYYPRVIFEKYPILINSLFDALNSNDVTVLPVALDTLGLIGATTEGKLCLVTLGGRYTQSLDRISGIIRNSVTEIKIRAIHCMANLIRIDKDSNRTSDPVDLRITLMTREWFRTLGKELSPMEVLLDICKNPFPDISLAALTLLDAACQHIWGEEMIAVVAGFIEYLLDRSIECTKESKEAKYDIIKRLSRSMVFHESIIDSLEAYVEEGPLYTEIEAQVAMEEE